MRIFLVSLALALVTADYRFMDAWGMPSQFSVVFDAERRVRLTITWRELIDMQD